MPSSTCPDRSLIVFRGALRLAEGEPGAPRGLTLRTEAGELLALTGQDVEAAGYRMGPGRLRFVCIGPAEARPAARRP